MASEKILHRLEEILEQSIEYLYSVIIDDKVPTRFKLLASKYILDAYSSIKDSLVNEDLEKFDSLINDLRDLGISVPDLSNIDKEDSEEDE